MMRRFVLVTLCLLSQGCYSQHETIYIAPSSSSSPPTLEGYAKKNATVRWEVLDANDSFQIKFKGSPPCQPTSDVDPFTAKVGHPATCKIKVPRGYKKGDVLRFRYQLIHTNKRPGDDQLFFEHVGSCDTCLYSSSPTGALAANSKATGTSTPASSSIPTDYIETLSCTAPYITPDPPPLDVSAGDRVHWQNPNDAGKPTWTIQFDDATACKAPVTFKNPTCEVTGVSSTKPYIYHVIVGNGQPPNGCKFDGSIVVK
jgi:hypothetical protein